MIHRKPVMLALGAAIATSLAVAAPAQAGFSANDLGSGYLRFTSDHSCGGKKGEEHKCGADHKKEAEGDEKKEAEHKCGEGKCGGSMKKEEPTR